MTDQVDASDCLEVAGWARVLQHIRDPQNLIGYLVLTAWMKFMGVSGHIPTITVG